jgi:Spy/CpxP family protein refolding chaperone
VSPWKVILATMVIFTCGVITGAMVTKTAHLPQAAVGPAKPRPPAGPLLQMQRVEFLEKLNKQLVLTPEQRGQIAGIMKASQERTQRVREQIAPQMTDERKRVRAEIRGVLTPEQRKQFAELMKGNRKADANGPGSHPVRPLEPNTAETNAL